MRKLHQLRQALGQGQMSDSLTVMALLTFSGGFQDAYTYWTRGKVFANAQTGNIVLMSGALFEGDLSRALRYMIPVGAFACGVFAAEQIRGRLKESGILPHWRQIVVLSEIVLLLSAGLLPEQENMLANALISFSCAMQVEAFQKVRGYAYASTMCIGNLRHLMSAVSCWTRTRDLQMRRQAVHYLAAILFFAVGSGFGTAASEHLGIRAIWISCALLLAAYGLMNDRGRCSSGRREEK